MLGEFDFSDEKLQDTIGVLPPKKQVKIIPENWGQLNRPPFHSEVRHLQVPGIVV